MKSWSDVRKTLEQDRLAPSLRGRVQYFITRYRGAHDDHGRIAIRVDGKEVFQSSIFSVFQLDEEISHRVEEKFPELEGRERWDEEWNQLIAEGAVSEQGFYNSFREYDTQPILQSLESSNPLVRVLAILDRRVGKRRLAAIKERSFDGEPKWVQFFYHLRLEAEGLLWEVKE